MPRTGDRRKRVESSLAAAAIDDIVGALRSCSTSAVYRTIARKSGLHPVTVMRYHRGELRTVPASTLDEIKRVKNEVIQEARQEASSKARRSSSGKFGSRVPCSRISEQVDRLMSEMGLTERQVLFRLVSERTGIHDTTILRYYNGSLATAPRSVLDCLISLANDCSSKKVPVFKRRDGGEGLVPRSQYRLKMDALFECGGYTKKAEMFRDVAKELQVDPERLRKAYYDTRIVLVPSAFVDRIEQKLESMTYDPSKTFSIGDRVTHPLFGPGIVTEKRAHDSFVLELKSGRKVLLREDYRHDPYWERAVQESWPEGGGEEDV